MGRRISKEFLHPSILEGVDNKIGNLDNLETDAKDNMVQAINELADKIDTEIVEGKELIASAIGEPLSSEDTFSAMSNDINSLLSTFKTNMMNNGVTVESSDKFKQLIDKIATMVEEGEGKGIQFAEGSGNWTLDGSSYASLSTTITTNLDFTPTYIFVYGNGNVGVSAGFGGNISVGVSNFIVSNLGTITTFDGALGSLSISDITSSSFVITTSNDAYFKMYATRWFAIGVGEEDTTLRDSLASILQEEGVSVTEEDDMASLISKVDEELLKGRYVLNADYSGYGLTIGEIARAAFMFSDTSWVSIGSSYTFPITGKVKISPTVYVAGTSSTGIVGRVKYRLTKKDGTVIHTAEMTKAEDGSGTVASFTIMVESGDVITTLGSINKAVSSVYPSIQHSAIITTNLIY